MLLRQPSWTIRGAGQIADVPFDIITVVSSEPSQPMKTCEQTCDHDCALIGADYRCTCRAGFILANDQRSCTSKYSSIKYERGFI